VALSGEADAGEAPKKPTEGKKTRNINPNPGGPNGPVIHFVNDDPTKPSPDLPVSEETAKMVEEVVAQSGLKSVTINSTTGGVHTNRTGHESKHYSGEAVDIDKINDRPVNDPSNRYNVKNLQDAFQ
jgi:hypothetical protein